ncbi:uncharacterized protein N7482_009570 [Penicillium canariense]|uniref:Major facilitator superfamily (MFS) profile domain-containing protein n=1 Tax=Penicillium canariense TaxID=189055 RepID=A0A9W9HPK6_9EURO|nr:uncharacterized protein N7482_009570 [Penicillium canariense]KAJ5153092.1 hypothetical protein N7482_009570 [Penicillium canariense]
MAPGDDMLADAPGTVYLVDVSHTSHDTAHAGHQDILLIPQPSPSLADPLNWPRFKKLWSLFLISAYACVFSFGENNWGASWTLISEDTGVSLTNMNGGSALNYLLLGFFNIIWIPTAMKLGRKIVYILSLVVLLGGSLWGGFYHGTAQYYIMLAIQGIGTAAYQALIQLTIFDMFFTHERGRMVAIYIFFQQLGSILGLILGGYISDGIGWRWSSPIVAIACGILILLFILTFDDTMFPRYRFNQILNSEPSQSTSHTVQKKVLEKGAQIEPPVSELDPNHTREDRTSRSFRQKMALVHYFADDRTTWFQYFRRPFYLFAFPNIVLAGIQFAFGCTAGIVSFNTISEIMTEPPYNWSAGSTGLLFLAALIGNFLGMGVGSLSDWIVLILARRNKGYKEPEMRIWTYIFPLCFGAVGYFTYGWAATNGDNWISIAVALCCLIAQQVSVTSLATAYAMECFDGISGELVVVLAICSSLINFAISYSVQPFIDATSYGWAFTCYGILVVLSILMGVPMIIWGKAWRRKCKGRYELFLAETSRDSH